MAGQHAFLSPSAAHRWMNCTAAPRLEASVPDTSSDFAREGSLAHAIGALKLKTLLGQWAREEMKEIEELTPGYRTPEMEEHTDSYVSIVMGKYNEALATTRDARLLVETRLDFGDYIPGAFGTSDATVIADGLMEVIDLKYGKGVRVSATRNAQMMIYALGAYLANSFEYDIRRIRMTIVQPRIDNLSEYELTVGELLEWAERELRPRAREAMEGKGEQRPGEWCQFCKVKASCRALAEKCLSTASSNPDPALLTPEQIASDVLPWLSTVKAWASTMEEHALRQALSGTVYPGYKLVAGRSVRRISDESSVIGLLEKGGYHESEYLKPRALMGIGDLEKLMGKKRFAALCSDYIVKPQGRPALVTEDDKRPPYNSAKVDFEGIEN